MMSSKGGLEGGLRADTNCPSGSSMDLPSHPLLRRGGEAGDAIPKRQLDPYGVVVSHPSRPKVI